MTKEELDFIGSMNMCDEISNDAYEKIVNHIEEAEISDDCVSRAEVLKQMKEWRDCEFVKMTNPYHYLEKRIQSMSPVTPTQRWIPVSERLPASDEDVLVTNGKEMYIGWINPTDKCWRVDSEGEYFMNDIVAWQPLPQPYEEKRGSEDGSN